MFSDTYRTILTDLEPHDTTLVAVSKTRSNEAIRDLYESGQRDFGENRVQELVPKAHALPDDIRWHMIGHLQRNKVKEIAGFIHMIHSVDSVRLAKRIQVDAERADRVIDVLLQVHIAAEKSKYGFDADALVDWLETDAWRELSNVRIRGLMGMATFTDDADQVRGEFKTLRTLFERLDASVFADHAAFDQLSMGMSGDYRVALEEGSTMVRVGSAIFGPRDGAA